MATLWALFWLGLWRYHIDPENRPHSYVERVRECFEHDKTVRDCLALACEELLMKMHGKDIKSTRKDGGLLKQSILDYHYRRFVPHRIRLKTEAFKLIKRNQENAGESFILDLSDEQYKQLRRKLRWRTSQISIREARNDKTFFDYTGPYLISLPIAFYFLICAPSWLVAHFR